MTALHATVSENAAPDDVRTRTISWNDPAPSRSRGRDLSMVSEEVRENPMGTMHGGGSVVHSGGRVATTEARVHDADGTLYAHATSTCLILRGPR